MAIDEIHDCAAVVATAPTDVADATTATLYRTIIAVAVEIIDIRHQSLSEKSRIIRVII